MTVSEAIADAIARHARGWGLSPAERRVLEAAIVSARGRVLARELRLSPNTLKVHAKAIAEKSGAGSLEDAVIIVRDFVTRTPNVAADDLRRYRGAIAAGEELLRARAATAPARSVPVSRPRARSKKTIIVPR